MSTKLTQISLNMYSVRASGLPFPQQLRKVREMGYLSIQGSRVHGVSKETLKATLDELGMEVSTYAGDLYSIDQDADAFIDECHYFDCDEIMIGCMPVEFREDEASYREGIKLVNAVGAKLAEGGVYLSYHNHAQEFRRFNSGITGMDLLFDNLNPATVHFMLDTHWVQAGGADVIEWIEKCAGRMQYLHVKDYRIGPANFYTGIGQVDKEFAEIGEGNLPWNLIIETGLSQGIKSFIVEQDFTYGKDPFDSVALSYNNLRDFGLK